MSIILIIKIYIRHFSEINMYGVIKFIFTQTFMAIKNNITAKYSLRYWTKIIIF